MYPLRGFSLFGVPLARPPVFLPFAIGGCNEGLKIKYDCKYKVLP